MNKNRLKLADVFHAGFSRYAHESGRMSALHYKVANAIMACGTAVLGGHVFKCDHCGHNKISYNSCRNRHCPSCQAQARAQWVDDRLNELLDVPYFHVVFTIPSQISAFALRNKKAVYDILYRAARETLIELGNDEARLGAQIGFIAVLHTWGQNLMHHPHIHCVVPAGGLRGEDEWVESKYEKFLFPVAVMQKLFKAKFIDYFKAGIASHAIELHGYLERYSDPVTYKQLLNELYAMAWVVYVKPPFAGPQAVVKYLGRYTHRIAIANSRLVRLSNTHVSFRWKDYSDGDKQKVMTLRIEEFLRRFLMHILPKGFVHIRYYGFLSCRVRADKLLMCKALTGTERGGEKEQDAVVEQQHSWICPLCNTGILRIYRQIHKPDPGGELSKAA